jgi:hypothetical protein
VEVNCGVPILRYVSGIDLNRGLSEYDGGALIAAHEDWVFTKLQASLTLMYIYC